MLVLTVLVKRRKSHTLDSGVRPDEALWSRQCQCQWQWQRQCQSRAGWFANPLPTQSCSQCLWCCVCVPLRCGPASLCADARPRRAGSGAAEAHSSQPAVVAQLDAVLSSRLVDPRLARQARPAPLVQSYGAGEAGFCRPSFPQTRAALGALCLRAKAAMLCQAGHRSATAG